jgi:hypothetical protein
VHVIKRTPGSSIKLIKPNRQADRGSARRNWREEVVAADMASRSEKGRGDSDTQRLGIQTPKGGFRGDSDAHRLGGFRGDSDAHRLVEGRLASAAIAAFSKRGFRRPQTWGIQSPTDSWRDDWPARRFAALGRCSETRPIVTADVCSRLLEVRWRAGCPAGRRIEMIRAHEAATLSEQGRHGDAC